MSGLDHVVLALDLCEGPQLPGVIVVVTKVLPRGAVG